MATWTSDELRKIGPAEELELASIRDDGTLGNPVTIWVIRVGDDLYARSWKGHNGAWFRATQARHSGHIKAGGVGKDAVAHEPIVGLWRYGSASRATPYVRQSKLLGRQPGWPLVVRSTS
jgi:hypothetical protein